MNILLIIALLGIVGILIWAIFGGREEKAVKEDETLKESTFRRRSSDRLIEEQFPDENQEELIGRERAAAMAAEDLRDGAAFKLPYLADEIIPEFSRFRIYRRTLINSEVYAQKGDFDTAISLYEGVRSRINDTEVRTKIEADIEYLEYFKKRKDEEKKKKEEQTRREMGQAPAGAGDAPKGPEVKVTIDGSIPENLTIGPMPNTINIGILDPGKTFDVDTLADKVKEKLQGASPELADSDALRKELGEMKKKMEELDRDSGLKARDMARIREEIENTDSHGLRDLKSDLHDLKRDMEKIRESAELESVPGMNQARFTQPPEVKLDTKPLLDLLKSIPRQDVPGPKELKKPGKGSEEDGGTSFTSEKSIERERKAEEDENEFELLSEFGKEKFKDELTDEEIFEKILKEKDDTSEQSFEVIGEKKVDIDEVSLTDTEMDSRKREDESFYKKLLATDRRKRKELPILKVSFDFTKLPDDFSLSREKNILEYSFYKYKPLLIKASDFIQKRKVRDAINYYKVVMAQNIPPEFKSMIRRNINDLTDYLEKYLTGD